MNQITSIFIELSSMALNSCSSFIASDFSFGPIEPFQFLWDVFCRYLVEYRQKVSGHSIPVVIVLMASLAILIFYLDYLPEDSIGYWDEISMMLTKEDVRLKRSFRTIVKVITFSLSLSFCQLYDGSLSINESVQKAHLKIYKVDSIRQTYYSEFNNIR